LAKVVDVRLLFQPSLQPGRPRTAATLPPLRIERWLTLHRLTIAPARTIAFACCLGAAHGTCLRGRSIPQPPRRHPTGQQPGLTKQNAATKRNACVSGEDAYLPLLVKRLWPQLSRLFRCLLGKVRRTLFLLTRQDFLALFLPFSSLSALRPSHLLERALDFCFHGSLFFGLGFVFYFGRGYGSRDGFRDEFAWRVLGTATFAA
jgi:hypothetical protein